MRKLFLLFFSFFLSVNMMAQLEVKEGSFREVEGFVNINTEKMYDDNDKPYAVLKVKTENINDKERRLLLFQGDARTFFEVEYKVGEVWLYISYYATYLKISHPDFGSTEFWFPFDMYGKKGYELTLVNKPSVDEDLVKRLEKLESATTIVGENTINHGYIIINTTPVDGATVNIDGEEMPTKTPFISKQIIAGRHRIRVTKDLYKPYVMVIDLEQGELKTLDVELKPNAAELKVTTADNAEIWIDGEKKGVGSWSGTIAAESHIIEAQKQGCRTQIQNVKLEVNGVKNVTFPALEKVVGSIEIVTFPSNAKITINNEEKGTSPKVFYNMPIGNYHIEISKSRFETVVTEVEVKDGEKSLVEMDLTPKYNQREGFGYKFITLNAAMNQYNDFTYGLTIGGVRRWGWFVNAMTNFNFDGFSSDYVCDENLYVDGSLPKYTGDEFYTIMSVMGGAIVRLTDVFAVRVGAGYGVNNTIYKTKDNKKVKNASLSEQGLALSLGVQGNFNGFVISIEAGATNFNIYEAKIGLGYGLKNR